MTTMTRKAWNRAAADYARTTGRYAETMARWADLDRSLTPTWAVDALVPVIAAKVETNAPAKLVRKAPAKKATAKATRPVENISGLLLECLAAESFETRGIDPHTGPCGFAQVIVCINRRTKAAKHLESVGFHAAGSGRLSYWVHGEGQGVDHRHTAARDIADHLVAEFGLDAYATSHLD